MRRALRRETVVTDALEKHAPDLQALGRRTWRFEVVNARPVPVTARLDDEWLVLDADPGVEATLEAYWPLLVHNRRLGSGSKFALRSESRSPRLLAEICLDEGVDVGTRLAETLRGIAEAVAMVEDSETGAVDRTAPAFSVDGARDGDADRWSRLVVEAGWPGNERAEGRIAIELDVPGAFYQAHLEGHVGDGVRLSVPVIADTEMTPIGRRALAVLLLTGSGFVRLARGAAEGGAGREWVGFEVGFASPPSAMELGHALAALSLACRRFGREAKALTNDNIASTYLEVRGWDRKRLGGALSQLAQRKGRDKRKTAARSKQ